MMIMMQTNLKSLFNNIMESYQLAIDEKIINKLEICSVY